MTSIEKTIPSSEWDEKTIEERENHAMRILIAQGFHPQNRICQILKKPNHEDTFLLLQEVESFKVNLSDTLDKIRDSYDEDAARHCAILGHHLLRNLIVHQITIRKQSNHNIHEITLLDNLQGEDERGVARTKDLMKQHTRDLLLPTMREETPPKPDSFAVMDRLHEGDPTNRDKWLNSLEQDS